ncbi:hypothetical protein BGZ74_006983 [Mortierella antarctica]|nr:hypothetical protein BGZ74_006983 [Mortierella antarctica]
MAFASKGWYLKTDFLMSSILALLGLIVLGTMASKKEDDDEKAKWAIKKVPLL